MRKNETIIGDGGVGTRLREIDPDIDFATFDEHRFSILHRIHREYVKDGADFVTADTIAAPHRLWRRLVSIARDATRGSGARVMLSLNEAAEVPDSSTLADVDSVIIETVLHPHNALALASAISHISPIDIFISFARTFPADIRFDNGETMFDVFDRINAITTVKALGINCIDISEAGRVLTSLRLLTSKPLFAQPSKTRFTSAESFATEMNRLNIEFNMVIAGGCCGTTPADISALRRALKH